MGEGTIVFDMQRKTPFCVVIRLKEIFCFPSQWISLEVGKDAVSFKVHTDNETRVVAERHGKTGRGETVGYEEDCRVSYWLSYDCNHLVLKYGKGYRMTETTILEYDFLKRLPLEQHVKERRRLHRLFSSETRKVIEQYDVVERHTLVKMYEDLLMNGTKYEYRQQTLVPIDDAPPPKKACFQFTHNLDQSRHHGEVETMARSMIDIEGMVDFDKTPLTCNWSPFVLDSSKITLFDLDSNNYTFSASLPSACRELYQNVVQDGVCLDWPPGVEKYKLTHAIRHSLENERGILHKKLLEKAGEFGAKNKTYLRITLGRSHGNSPGIPYVLEIWPKGHGSPIHSHGNSYAVIKVVHGGLTISIYNKHVKSEDEPRLLHFDVKQGDVTWTSPNWYQTHKLWNSTNDYCATIQCYQYGDNNDRHWPYFNYISCKGTIEEFLPNSDFTFREMREKVLKEYQDSMVKSERQVVS